jgi:hypothetical protein
MPWVGARRDADALEGAQKCFYGCGRMAAKVVRIEPSHELVLLCTQHYGLAIDNVSVILARLAGWPKETSKMRRHRRRLDSNMN